LVRSSGFTAARTIRALFLSGVLLEPLGDALSLAAWLPLHAAKLPLVLDIVPGAIRSLTPYRRIVTTEYASNPVRVLFVQ